jgi:hypothetical protein
VDGGGRDVCENFGLGEGGKKDELEVAENLDDGGALFSSKDWEPNPGIKYIRT